MKTSVTKNNPRTSAGRKVDTWQYALPEGGKAAFDVNLHTDTEGAWFTATTKNEILKSISVQSTDINALSVMVAKRVEAALGTHYSAEWSASLIIETTYDARHYMHGNLTADRGVSISIGATPADVNVAAPIGNDGKTMISTGKGPSSIIQRSHDAHFDRAKSLDPDEIFLGRESDYTTSRVAVPETDENIAKLADLTACLKSFGAKLADRMSPMNIAAFGMPAPKDLTDMMQAAAAEPRKA